MTGPIKIYQIYYGNWIKADSSQKLFDYFINHLDASPWFNVVKEYYQIDVNNQKKYITGPILTSNTITDYYSQGKNLTDF
ncbi:hypothetical protein BC936DRAFT_143780, partial [Jimgerdemannia flammicorona]